MSGLGGAGKGRSAEEKEHRANTLELVMRKPTFWFPTWSYTNQKMDRGLKFRT